MSIPEGFEVLPGRGKDNAQAALAKAVENGFAPEDVRTVREGYLIPTKDAPKTEDEAPAEEAPAEETKDEAPAEPEKKSTTKRGASKKE